MKSYRIRISHILFVVLVLFAAPDAGSAAEAGPFTVEIADVGKSQDFAALLKAKGYNVLIPPKNSWVNDPESNCAVWIGKRVPLDMLRVVIPEAIRFNPKLKFYHVVGDRGEQPPEQVNNTIHVGGNIEAAMFKKLKQIDNREILDSLKRANSAEELHQYLHEKNTPKAQADGNPAPDKRKGSAW